MAVYPALFIYFGDDGEHVCDDSIIQDTAMETPSVKIVRKRSATLIPLLIRKAILEAYLFFK